MGFSGVFADGAEGLRQRHVIYLRYLHPLPGVRADDAGGLLRKHLRNLRYQGGMRRWRGKSTSQESALSVLPALFAGVCADGANGLFWGHLNVFSMNFEVLI